MLHIRILSRAALAGALLLGFAGVAAAQESPADQETRIVVRDGGVYVDGERVADAEGAIVFETEDGERVFVHRDGPGVEVRRFHGEMPERMVRVFRQARDGERGVMDEMKVHVERMGEPGFEFDFAPMAEHMRGVAEMMRFEGVMDADVRRLEREALELARRARELEGRERREAERELTALLDQAFDARKEARRECMAEQRERLDDEARVLDERARRKAEIVERRQRELLGEDDLLDW